MNVYNSQIETWKRWESSPSQITKKFKSLNDLDFTGTSSAFWCVLLGFGLVLFINSHSPCPQFSVYLISKMIFLYNLHWLFLYNVHGIFLYNVCGIFLYNVHAHVNPYYWRSAHGKWWNSDVWANKKDGYKPSSIHC